MTEYNPYLSDNLTGLCVLQRNLQRRVARQATAALLGYPDAQRKLERNRRRLALCNQAIQTWLNNYYWQGVAA